MLFFISAIASVIETNFRFFEPIALVSDAMDYSHALCGVSIYGFLMIPYWYIGHLKRNQSEKTLLQVNYGFLMTNQQNLSLGKIVGFVPLQNTWR